MGASVASVVIGLAAQSTRILAIAGRALDITYGFIDFVVARRRRSRFHRACLATIWALQPFVENPIHGCADKHATNRGNLANER
jgi:hypothetical protein